MMEKKRIPKRRFREFLEAGEWEEKEFSKITHLAGIRNNEGLPLMSYSITNENGFVPQN